MDLKEILAVSGKSGLFKIIAHNKTGVIVESMLDHKRMPVYATDKISNLEEISVFTTDKDILLKEVFKLIYEKENGGKAIDSKSDDKKLREYFEQVLPNFDKEKVYTSDIRKMFVWYNQLHENNMLDFTEKEEEKAEESDAPAEPEAKPVKAAKKKESSKE
jgi:hypothetical protein